VQDVSFNQSSKVDSICDAKPFRRDDEVPLKSLKPSFMVVQPVLGHLVYRGHADIAKSTSVHWRQFAQAFFPCVHSVVVNEKGEMDEIPAVYLYG